jgi:hypothetical protein
MLIGVVMIVVVLAVVVAFRSSQYRVERSVRILAPPAVVFAQVNDFHHWQPWSPWAKLDPAAKNTFEGPSSGTGAIFKWSGNNKIGEGRMTLLESHPDELIGLKLEFVRPFAGASTAEFKFKSEGNQTLVTWSTIGHKNFMVKAMCLVMDMDKMIGAQFEKGLADLKAISEAAG